MGGRASDGSDPKWSVSAECLAWRDGLYTAGDDRFTHMRWIITPGIRIVSLSPDREPYHHQGRQREAGIMRRSFPLIKTLIEVMAVFGLAALAFRTVYGSPLIAGDRERGTASRAPNGSLECSSSAPA
jgi:hypothetical protein